MGVDKRDLISVLKTELDFLEKGGYGKKSWRPNLIFEDSPSCINYGDPQRTKPCSECVLTLLVPPDKQKEQIPCRFIPLNALGSTVASLYQTATQDELEAEVRNWLRAMIKVLDVLLEDGAAERGAELCGKFCS